VDMAALRKLLNPPPVPWPGDDAPFWKRLLWALAQKPGKGF
jgi:hypothetical protein